MIETRIMAVLSRRHYAEQIKASVPGAKIVYDDRGENGGGDAWYNAKRCWLDSSPASHKLVLQDDIELCDDFMSYVKICRDFMPNAVWSFYVGWKAEQKLPQNADTPFVRIRGCKTGAPAILIPAEYCERIVSETDSVFGAEYKHDDSRIGWWCAYNGIPMMTTMPQLVQHQNIKSVLNHSARRFSRTYVQDVSSKDWCSKKYIETSMITPFLWTDAPKAVSYCKESRKREKERKHEN